MAVSKKTKISKIYNLVGTSFDGFFSDEYWAPVNNFWNQLSELDINFSITSAEYLTDKDGQAVAKIWRFEIDTAGATIYGSVTASGAGCVDDILGVYDLALVLS